MPFIPLTPDEEKQYKELYCTHPEHNPPSHMVIRKTMKYQCPGCKRTMIIHPNKYYLHHRPPYDFPRAWFKTEEYKINNKRDWKDYIVGKEKELDHV